MDETCQLFCMVNSEDNVGIDVEPMQWTTFTWIDEFGNSIAPFFTSIKAGQPFLDASRGWQLKQFPASIVVAVILADLKQETSFYTIDAVTMQDFKALTAVEFLTELIYRRHPAGNETPVPIQEHEGIVPLEALFGGTSDPAFEREYRHLMSVADVIFGIDVVGGIQSIVFGKSCLEELVRTGHSRVLGIVNVGLSQQAQGIDRLTELVAEIKGYHDYYAENST